ncbi:MAG: hypothetical protein WBL93_14905 [Lutisporaceae bacterium]
MNVEDMILNSLKVLTSDGTFRVNRIEYNEKNFGNVFAILNSNNQVDIRFVKDRGDFWCELSQAGEWYFIEDVFALIGVAVVNKSGDFIDFTAEMSALIKMNITQIFQAFNVNNSKDTQSKVKVLATKRVMGMLKL